MPVSPRPSHIGALLVTASVVAGCSSASEPAPTQSPSASSAISAPPAGLSNVDVTVPPDMTQAPFDQPRQVQVPTGWQLSVWARTPRPRLALWAPDGTLLVSVPSAGTVLRFTPGSAGATESVLLDELDQPHGLAMAGSTLYVAQSDQVVAYDYANGAATGPPLPRGGQPPSAGG